MPEDLHVVRDEVVRRAWEELEPELVEQGYELVEVEYGQHGSTWFLRLYIDCEDGVTIDNCAEVSQFLSPLLDKLDFLDGRYTMEVSSPGIDRPVRKAVDFSRYLGERIRVQTIEPVAGRRRIKGVLRGFEDGLIRVETDDAAYEVHIENLKKANLDR